MAETHYLVEFNMTAFLRGRAEPMERARQAALDEGWLAQDLVVEVHGEHQLDGRRDVLRVGGIETFEVRIELVGPYKYCVTDRWLVPLRRKSEQPFR